MKWKNKPGVYLDILLVVLLLAVVVPCKVYAQEVFPQQTPAQESLQNIRDAKGPLRAGGGTGTGDSTNSGGGTENTGHQNDTNVPTSDALPLVVLLTVGYGIYCHGIKKEKQKTNTINRLR